MSSVVASKRATQFRHIFAECNEAPIDDVYSFSQKTLGRGGFGVVYKGLHKLTGQPRAVKAIDLSKVPCQSKLLEEFNIQRSLVHPNIVRLFEVFSDFKKMYLVMELCTGGELFDLLVSLEEQGIILTEAGIAKYMKQIMSAVSYLHAQSYVHRDLKPENFLLEHDAGDAQVKIIDFGLSKKLKRGSFLKSKVGTPFYVAPDVLRGHYNEKCDIWSSGVILYFMIYGKPPFLGENPEEILRSVLGGKFQLDSPDSQCVSEDVKHLITKMLTSNPVVRPSASESLAHPWFDEQNQSSARVAIPEGFSTRLKDFLGVSRMKKAALTVVASEIDPKAVEELRTIFQALDTNLDGTLTVQEFTESMKKHKLEVGGDVERALLRMDSDGSGSIDYTEFLAATMSQHQYLNKDVLWSTFRRFDRSGDGHIQWSEIKEMLGQTDDEAKMMIQQADVNGDGKLSFQEFCNIMESYTK